jgi:hypothetical protein
MYSSDTPVFNVHSAAGLQTKVWFEIMFYLCRRGQENLPEMNKSTFAVATEGERCYVHQVVDEMDKHHRENSDDSVTEGRVYDIPGIFLENKCKNTAI